MVGVPFLAALLQVLAVLLGSGVEDVEGVHASAQCVQLGTANNNQQRHSPYTDLHRAGPWSIGTRKFDVIYQFLDFAVNNQYAIDNSVQDCPYAVNQTTEAFFAKYRMKALISDPCPTDQQVQIRTYVVKQDGKVMTGWLHFEVELMDPSDSILGIYVQVRDEFFNAIGEFVTHREEQCEPDDRLVQPTEFQILPCSAVGFREAKISNAIFMAERSVYRNQIGTHKFIPKESIARGIHFTWRMSEYWCNRHLRIRPEAIILTKNILAAHNTSNAPFVYRKAAAYWLLPRWFGAADIKLPATTLLCNEQVIDYGGDGTLAKDPDTGKLVAPWLKEKGVKSRLENDYFAAKQWYRDNSTGSPAWTLKSCQFNTRVMKPPKGQYPDDPYLNNTLPTFAGRCTHHFEKTPSHDALQGCNLDASAPEFQDLLDLYPNMTTYSNYVGELTGNRTRFCSLDCRGPTRTDNDTDLNDIKKYTDHSGEGNFTEVVQFHSDSRKKAMFEKFWSGRKYHAVLCIVWTMFLTPLGIFCARYFKETCMNRVCTGAHLWFWIHIGTAVAASMLFISSLSGIWKNLETWGRSTQSFSKAHREIGYFSAGLFFLMIVLGGFRPTERVPRRILMTAHSVLGFMIYFFNILAMIFAGYIPASPSMGDCDLEGNSIKESGVFYVVVIWIAMDFVLHGVMTALQVMKDTAAGVRRSWYCPIVPILPFDSTEDFPGSKIRMITLLIYAVTAFLMTFTAVGLVNNPELPRECWTRTGPTTCAEKFGCSGEARGYFAMVTAQTKNTSGHYVFGEGFW